MQETINYQGVSYKVVNQSYFAYVFAFNDASIAPAASANDSNTIENDSFFLLTELTGVVLNAALDAVEASPLLSLQIRDTGTGRQMFNKPAMWSATVGTSQLPFILPEPTLFKQLSTIQATIANVNTADTYGRVQLAFIGSKIFVK